MSRKFDVLISGQGIAGSLLSWFFIKKGFTVLVIDEEREITSSKIAGGMIHPITGRRLVKSWNAELLIPFAISTFKEIENVLGKKYFHEMPVLEVFHDNGHRNDWISKSEDPSCADFIGAIYKPSEVEKTINAPLGGQYVINSGWLDTASFLNDYKNYLIKNNFYYNEKINSSDLELIENGVRWKDVEAKYFVNCTGIDSLKDKFWNWLPFNPAKGEILEINCEGLPDDKVIHNRIKIIPLKNNNYKCGATYTWDSFDDIPSGEGLKKLTTGINNMISAPYKITSHKAAVRPSTFDRRPFSGKHPQHPQLVIFNGLGTKGVMLAPFFAEQLAEHLMNGGALDPEVDVARIKFANE